MAKIFVTENPTREKIHRDIETHIDYEAVSKGKPYCFSNAFSFYTLGLPKFDKYSQQRLKTAFLNIVLDLDMDHDLKQAGALNFHSMFSRFLAVKSPRDGNCLLHSVSLQLWGVEDENQTLRRLLFMTFSTDHQDKFQTRWRRQRLTDIHSLAVEGLNTMTKEWEELKKNVSTPTAHLPGNQAFQFKFLESIHIYVLANILRRPIIVFGDATSRSVAGSSLQENLMTGIYLPLEWEPFQCCKTPICLGFSLSHFCPLLTDNSTEKCLIPIVHSDLTPLSVKFCLENEERNVGKLLQDYFIVKELICEDSSVISCVEYTLKPFYFNIFENFLKQIEAEFLLEETKNVPVNALNATAPSVTGSMLSLNIEVQENGEPLSMLNERCINQCGYRASVTTTPYCHECVSKTTSFRETNEIGMGGKTGGSYSGIKPTLTENFNAENTEAHRDKTNTLSAKCNNIKEGLPDMEPRNKEIDDIEVSEEVELPNNRLSELEIPNCEPRINSNTDLAVKCGNSECSTYVMSPAKLCKRCQNILLTHATAFENKSEPSDNLMKRNKAVNDNYGKIVAAPNLPEVESTNDNFSKIMVAPNSAEVKESRKDNFGKMEAKVKESRKDNFGKMEAKVKESINDNFIKIVTPNIAKVKESTNDNLGKIKAAPSGTLTQMRETPRTDKLTFSYKEPEIQEIKTRNGNAIEQAQRDILMKGTEKIAQSKVSDHKTASYGKPCTTPECGKYGDPATNNMCSRCYYLFKQGKKSEHRNLELNTKRTTVHTIQHNETYFEAPISTTTNLSEIFSFESGISNYSVIPESTPRVNPRTELVTSATSLDRNQSFPSRALGYNIAPSGSYAKKEKEIQNIAAKSSSLDIGPPSFQVNREKRVPTSSANENWNKKYLESVYSRTIQAKKCGMPNCSNFGSVANDGMCNSCYPVYLEQKLELESIQKHGGVDIPDGSTVPVT